MNVNLLVTFWALGAVKKRYLHACKSLIAPLHKTKSKTSTIYIYNNNNNRLFMAPHLLRAWSIYKDIRIYSFHHTHTHTHRGTQANRHAHAHAHACITGDGLVEWVERKKKRKKDQYVEEKRWVFSSDLVWGWEKRARRTVEMKQLREVWRSCARANVKACSWKCSMFPKLWYILWKYQMDLYHPVSTTGSSQNDLIHVL